MNTTRGFLAKWGSGANGAAFWFLAAYLGYGLLRHSVLADWPGFVADEGVITYGAQRLREGLWPYRDFFFPWPPGILAVHGILQAAGLGVFVERFASLLAAAFAGACLVRWGRTLGFGRGEEVLLGLLLLVWGFTLRNVPDPTWFALWSAFGAVGALQGGRWLAAALLLLVAFWFRQSIGGLVFLVSLAWLLQEGGRKPWLFTAVFLLGVILPVLALWPVLGVSGVSEMARRLALAPLWHFRATAEAFPRELIGAPLATLGLWAISLYFFRSSARWRGIAQVAVMVYAGTGFMREGRGFFLGCFFLFSLAAWVASFLVLTQINGEQRRPVILRWISGFAISLALFPFWGFPQFLCLFPLSAFFLVWTLRQVRLRYAWLPAGWVWAPALMLLVGGGVLQARLNFFSSYGEPDAMGFVSFGDGHRLNGELAKAKNFLVSEGVMFGEPVLVLPNAPSFYRFAGYRNPTPFDQLLPAYLEGVGASERDILPGFARAGGQYLVLQPSLLSPALMAEVRENYRALEVFRHQFSVWKKK